MIEMLFPQFCNKDNYPYRNYVIIDFERLIGHLFPGESKFITDFDFISKIRKTEEEFKTQGILSKVNINELYYYQKFVGILGPKHSNINDPKCVIQVEGKMILFNGYHRTLFNIANKEPDIEAFVLKVP